MTTMDVSLGVLAVCTMLQTYWIWRSTKRKRDKCAIGGVCCACLYQGERETPCYARTDQVHCEHWWDGKETAI